MDQASDDIKLLFIQEELSLFGEELCDALSDAILKQKLIDSGSLLDSLNYSSFMEGNNPGQRVSFFSYGRCVDMSGYKKTRYRLIPIARSGVYVRIRIKKIAGMPATCMVD